MPVSQVAPNTWIGWLVYSVVALVAFLTLKIVNIRLHQSLGNDPPPPSETTPTQDNEDDSLDEKPNEKDEKDGKDEKGQ